MLFPAHVLPANRDKHIQPVPRHRGNSLRNLFLLHSPHQYIPKIFKLHSPTVCSMKKTVSNHISVYLKACGQKEYGRFCFLLRIGWPKISLQREFTEEHQLPLLEPPKIWLPLWTRHVWLNCGLGTVVADVKIACICCIRFLPELIGKSSGYTYMALPQPFVLWIC